MIVQEVMSADVRSIGPFTSIQEAARLMAARNVGILPVLDSQGHLQGVVTDRDITVRSLANGLWPHSTIDRVMTLHPETIDKEADLERALEKMHQAQIGRLIVTDGYGHVVGILSLGDVLSKGDVPDLVPKVSQVLRHRSTVLLRPPDQYAHIG